MHTSKSVSLFYQEEGEKPGTRVGSEIKFTEEEAAVKIQASYRGYKTRKEIKGPKEETEEKEEPTEPTEPDKGEPEQAEE